MHNNQKYLYEMGVDTFWYKDDLDISTTTSNLADLEKNVKNCTKCRLYSARTNTVFGSGSKRSKIMIIGEAPGKEEDETGLPFIGRAGKLLDAMLLSIKLHRDDIYITNTIKCRPPYNRDPMKDEIDSCSKYLESQINIINPYVLILLGKVAASRILKKNLPMSELRQKKFQIDGYKPPIIVFYHPAYLLRSPSNKYKAWQDLVFLQKEFLKDVS